MAEKFIGSYEIISQLGKGNMGVVYKVKHPESGASLAAKVLLQGQKRNDENIKRFYQEIELVSRLKHPNIIAIHDVGSHNGFPFYLMDYIDGQTMDEFIKENAPLPEREALEMMEKIALALGCAHKLKIIHRDLKPANIIITKDGTPYLTDFGIAKCKDGMNKNLTPAGFIMGTPLYMAPEQASGKKKLLGSHSDVYSLGTNLYQMLTGQVPFMGRTTMMVMDMVINQEPVPVRDVNDEISKHAEDLVKKAMAKSVKERYADANEFAVDIRAVLSGKKDPRPKKMKAILSESKSAGKAAQKNSSGCAMLVLGVIILYLCL